MNSSVTKVSTRGAPRPRPADVDAVVDRILQVVPRSMGRIRAEMRTAGSSTLTVPQLRTLLYLRRRPGSSLSPLADHLGLTLPAASGLVERLVRAGLVERVTDPVERRRIQLRLTPLGAEHVGRAHLLVRSRLAADLAELSAAELARLSAGLELLAGLARADGDRR